jgi:hypothetical protein
MKKALVLAAALTLAATPAVAQQSASSPGGDAPAVQAASATAPVAAPSIWVSQEEIRQRVAAAEAERENAQIGSSQWWYLVAAIAIGVIIAALIL